MNAPRFGKQQPAEVMPRLSPAPGIAWVPLARTIGPRIGGLVGEVWSSEDRSLLALVSHPAPSSPGTPPTARVLIFDNHPDTVRLLATSLPAAEEEEESESFFDRWFGVCLFLDAVLIGLGVVAIFWPLIGS